MESEQGQDTAGRPMPIPDLPPYRTWHVTQRQMAKDGSMWTKEQDIRAHDVELTPNGGVIRWMEWFFGPERQPEKRVLLSVFRPIDGWVEYSEGLPETRSLIDVSGNMLGSR